MYRLLNKFLVYLTTWGLWGIIGQRCPTDPTSSCPWGFKGQSRANTDPVSSSENSHILCGDCIRFSVTHNRLGRTIRAWVMLTALHRIMETSVTSQRCFLRLMFGCIVFFILIWHFDAERHWGACFRNLYNTHACTHANSVLLNSALQKHFI